MLTLQITHIIQFLFYGMTALLYFFYAINYFYSPEILTQYLNLYQNIHHIFIALTLIILNNPLRKFNVAKHPNFVRNLSYSAGIIIALNIGLNGFISTINQTTSLAKKPILSIFNNIPKPL